MIFDLSFLESNHILKELNNKQIKVLAAKINACMCKAKVFCCKYITQFPEEQMTLNTKYLFSYYGMSHSNKL